jgi:hypothetical protein
MTGAVDVGALKWRLRDLQWRLENLLDPVDRVRHLEQMRTHRFLTYGDESFGAVENYEPSALGDQVAADWVLAHALIEASATAAGSAKAGQLYSADAAIKRLEAAALNAVATLQSKRDRKSATNRTSGERGAEKRHALLLPLKAYAHRREPEFGAPPKGKASRELWIARKVIEELSELGSKAPVKLDLLSHIEDLERVVADFLKKTPDERARVLRPTTELTNSRVANARRE